MENPVILTTQAEARDTRHTEGVMFLCAHCLEVQPVHTSGGTGYGYDDQDRITCYACCGKLDTARLIETGRGYLYLTCDAERPRPRPRVGSFDYAPYRLSNWPGSIEFKTRGARIGAHNIAGRRYDVWFTGPDGAEWHGVQYGDNTQICHVRRLKAKAA